MRTPSVTRLAILASILAPLLLSGCDPHRKPTREEIYNEWKDRCYRLSTFYHNRLKHPPYHMIAEHEADNCSTPDPAYQWDADAENLDILVANLFYHRDFKIQRKALDMLEHYRCQDDRNCARLADLLDAHIRASLPTQTPEWKADLHPHVRDFWRHLQDLR